MTDNFPIINERIHKLLHVCEEKFDRQYSTLRMASKINIGRKYIKIQLSHSSRENTAPPNNWHVWCFIDKQTGAVYKPADWRGPAKGIRYQLLDDDSYADACERVDPHGSWLYIR